MSRIDEITAKLAAVTAERDQLANEFAAAKRRFAQSAETLAAALRAEKQRREEAERERDDLRRQDGGGE